MVADFDRPRLIALMVGRELENFDATHDGASEVGEAVLRVRDFSARGQLRRRLARRRAGRGRRTRRARRRRVAPSCSRRSSASAARTGAVEVAGRPALFRSPRAAIAAGVGFVPADRKLQGLVLQMSVRENLMMAASSRTGRYRMPRKAVETERVRVADQGHGDPRARPGRAGLDALAAATSRRSCSASGSRPSRRC